MRIFDPKFKGHIPAYLAQCLLAMTFIFTGLLLIDSFSTLTIVASLGASTFLAFTMPHSHATRPRYFIGGYIVGILCGIGMHYTNLLMSAKKLTILGHSPHILTCALAVGLAMLIMTALNFEHPPAVALAMGLVLERRLLITAAAAFSAILILAFLKLCLKSRLRNLL